VPGIDYSVIRMTTFVLIPGFFLGAWSWRPVTDALRSLGHDVHPLSLTGLGERAHLSNPDVDLETHITDVLNLLRYEDLHDVVLVGHSYGGIVTTAAADRAPDRIAKLVYVDTGPLPDGVSQHDFARQDPPEDWKLPPPDWAAFAPDGVDVDALTERAVFQPWKTAIQPVRLTGAWEKLPRLGIMSSMTIAQMEEMAAARPDCRHMAGDQWTFVELPTWHWPMLSRPAELARILAEHA
jgi:pimeloyl-ACP methyl ester carboxylesterase